MVASTSDQNEAAFLLPTLHKKNTILKINIQDNSSNELPNYQQKPKGAYGWLCLTIFQFIFQIQIIQILFGAAGFFKTKFEFKMGHRRTLYNLT